MTESNYSYATPQHWDTQATDFADEPDHGLRDPAVRDAWRDLLSEWLPPPPVTILDIGCGVGNKTFYLAKRFPKSQVTGSDFSETGILEARKHFTSNNLKYVVGEASDKSKIKRADLVTFFEVLEHVDDWKSVLSSTIKTTDAQYILIGSPTGKRYEGGIHMGHVLHFKKGEIEDYLKNKGYKQVSVMYAGFPFVSPVFRDLSQAMQKQYAEFVKSKPSRLHSLINVVWYFLFRHLSTTKAGNQFMGLFVKE